MFLIKKITLLLITFQALNFSQAQCLKQADIRTKVEFIDGEELSPNTAITQLESLKNEYKKCHYPLDSIYAKILHNQGKALRTIGDLKGSIKLFREAIKINEQNNNLCYPANCINGYFNLLLVYISLNQEIEMITALKQLVKLTAKYPERILLEGRAFNNVSLFYLEKGDYQQSIDYARLGRRSLNIAKSQIFIAENLCMEGQTLLFMENWSAAKLCYQKAYIAVKDDNDPQTLSQIYASLARIEKKEQKFQKAIEYLLKANELIQPLIKSPDRGISDDAKNQAAIFLTLIGDIYSIDPNMKNRALSYYRQAYELSQDESDKSQIMGNEAMIYKYQGQFDLAIATFQKSLRLNIHKTDTNPLASAINISPSRRLLEILIQDKADTWLDFAKHTKNDKKKLTNALNAYMLADTMIDYIRWSQTGNVSKLFWRNKTRSMYERAIETCFLLNDPARALYFFEKSRAVLLNDQLNELGANQLLTPVDQEQEKRLRQAMENLQDKLAEGEEKEAAKIRAQLFTAQEKFKDFIQNIEKTHPQYYAYKYNNSVLSLSDLRKSILADRQTFLSYFVGDSAMYGLSISPTKVLFKKIDLGTYSTASREFLDLIASKEKQNKNFPNYLSVSARLYELLIKPFLIPPGSRLIVSPDGNLLPLEALSKSPNKPDYLVKDYAFSYTYSAGFLDKSKRKERSFLSTHNFLGFAPVKFASELKQVSLPGSDLALREIDANFSFTRSLTGSAASRQAFFQKTSDYRIVQLLTHANADSSETTPTLYFADSTLKLTELSPSLRSRTDLLVLSACQTGIGKNQRGEGVFSLARGFAAVGIPSTLTTLWSVENEAIYKLTNLFYNGLTDDLPLDLALQQAQIHWLTNASKSNQLPYSWAGIVLVGNSEPIITSNALAITCIVLAMLITILLFAFLRKSLHKSR